MRIIQAKRVLWAICLLAVLPQAVVAHDLEDGFVERAVQARIRGQQLTVEYAIGLTEPTMQQLLSASKWQASKCDEPSDGSAAEESEPGIREQFKRFAGSEIKNRLKMTVDGKIRQWKVDSITEYPKHHFDFVIALKCELSTKRNIEILLQDTNFESLDGAVRYAFKSSGKTIVSRTNVAPIIVRAKRLELTTLKPDERHKACQINATIVLLASDTKD